ncbi:NAD(P)-dependent alcohol dehydrogenase [Nakamurella sp. GG22]
MRVSVLHGPGKVELEERPVPRPGPGEVLVQIGSVGICGSDVHYYRHGRIAEYVVREPLVLGHEAGGRITAVGQGVDPGRIGQRVALEPGVPCRLCRECKAGRYNLCRDVRFFATPPIDGTFAEFVALAADFAHPVPDTLSDDAAALMEPLSVGVWACDKAQVGAGRRVLISGAGPIGIMTVQVARALGATEIVVSDVAPARLAAARSFGATRTLDARTDGGEIDGLDVDAAIDCSGAPPAIAQAIRAVRPAGRLVLVGMGADEITLPLGLIQGREITVTGTFRYANTYPTAIALAASGRVELDRMVTSRYGLEDAERALSLDADPAAMKVVVLPGVARVGANA